LLIEWRLRILTLAKRSPNSGTSCPGSWFFQSAILWGIWGRTMWDCQIFLPDSRNPDRPGTRKGSGK